MSCWMSSGSEHPTIEYILCAFAHIVVIICILLVAQAFLALAGKNDKHKSVTM